MIARKWTGVILVLASLFLVPGCGREKPKNNFQLGREHFLASNYTKSMMRLETWLQQDPNNEKGHNVETHAILAVMYHDDETRQKLYEAEMKKLKETGEPGMAVMLELVQNPTTASRLGNTIADILVQGGELSIGPLMRDLKGTNPRLRRYAQKVLIQLGEPAVEPLIQLLDSPDPYDRSRAVEALRRIGDKRAVEPLQKKLDDPSKITQVQVAAALHALGHSNNPTKEIIVNALKDENVEVRQTAARAMWELIDDPPLELLLLAMKDPNADVRNYATLAVSKTRSPEAVKPLVKILEKDENDQVKNSAARSLEKIGEPAVEPLIKMLEGSKQMALTIRIVQILGTIGDKRAIEPMEKVYKETSNSLLRNETAKALNKID